MYKNTLLLFSLLIYNSHTCTSLTSRNTPHSKQYVADHSDPDQEAFLQDPKTQHIVAAFKKDPQRSLRTKNLALSISSNESTRHEHTRLFAAVEAEACKQLTEEYCQRFDSMTKPERLEMIKKIKTFGMTNRELDQHLNNRKRRIELLQQFDRTNMSDEHNSVDTLMLIYEARKLGATQEEFDNNLPLTRRFQLLTDIAHVFDTHIATLDSQQPTTKPEQIRLRQEKQRFEWLRNLHRRCTGY